jgi:hypothetical protein
MSVPYDLVCGLLERCWWCVDDDLQGAVGLVVIGVDGDADAVTPDSFGEVTDVAFAGVELDFVLDGVEEEAFEVTKGVKREAGDFAGISAAVFVVVAMMMAGMLRMGLGGHALERWRHGGGVAA